MTRAIRWTLIGAGAAFVALSAAWAAMAILYSNLPGGHLRAGLAALWIAAVILVFGVLPGRRRTFLAYLVVFSVIAGWWATIPASNDRDWQPDVAVLPHATVAGDRVTIHNIRNFRYRTESDFDPRYEDRTFDLSRLDSVDLLAVYWMGDAIAHVMVSFGFGETDFVTFSIETRKEEGEAYSTVKGFFKQYELIYVVGDERDLVRLRTDYRKPPEDVYLYRTRIPPENARILFLDYLAEINRLRTRPEWYNTFTTNCTTNVVRHVKAFGSAARINWKVLLSGYAPQYAYELGSLDTRIPFAELRRMSHVNAAARRIGDDPAFSARIREGLPRPMAGGR